MSILWMGANPGLRLFADDETTAWAGLCQVDWSVRGTGLMLILWRDGQTRVLGGDHELATWITETFIGPMSRSPSGASDRGVTWGPIHYEAADVEMAIDLETGLSARAGDVAIEMSRPLDRELIYRDAYDIEGEVYRVSFVHVPCAEGAISVDGRPVPGEPRLWTDESGRQRSTAQIAVAEVWSR